MANVTDMLPVVDVKTTNFATYCLADVIATVAGGIATLVLFSFSFFMADVIAICPSGRC